MQTNTTPTLLAAIRQDPDTGLRWAMRDYAALVRGIARRILPGQDRDIEECTADVFVALWRNASRLETADVPVRAWLIVTARNVCRNELKRSRRRDVPAVERADPTPLLDETLLAVRALPEKYRLPLYLFYYEGYPTADIARLLRRPDASIRSDLRRGRMLLKQALGGAEK